MNAMPDNSTPSRYGLVETEKAMIAHVEKLALDVPAALAVSSLYRAANAVRNHLTNTVLRENDLSWTGFVVLWSLWIWDGLESRHAAESAAISKGTLTGVAKTLETRGWLRREVSTTDRRMVHLTLTADGIALMERLFPKLNAAEAQVVARIGAPELSSLTESLRTMVTTLEETETRKADQD
jgi:DNA-binding MarR family transcriptional regulator